MASVMEKRLQSAKRLHKPAGIICVTMVDYEVHRLKVLIEDHFLGTILGALVIKNNPSGRSTVRPSVTAKKRRRKLGQAFVCG